MPAGRPKCFDTAQALDRAVDVFWKRGFEAASMAELVEAMGIGRQSLYDTFGDKRALFVAALDRYAEARVQPVIDRLEQSESPLQGLRSVLAEWSGTNRCPANKGCLLTTSLAEFGAADPEIRALIMDQTARLEQAVCSALERAIEAGELPRSTNAREMARAFTIVAQGQALLGRTGYLAQDDLHTAGFFDRMFFGWLH